MRTDSVFGSDIGIHVTDKKGINFYTDLIKSKRESWKPFHKPETKEDIDKSSKMRDDLVGSLYEKVNILPLKGKLDNTITIPDMVSFRTPSQWIKEMSTTLDPFGFPEKDKPEEMAGDLIDKGHFVQLERFGDARKVFPKKSVLEDLNNDIKLWKYIIKGADKHTDLRQDKKEKSWEKFLRNILDRKGADAFSYKNNKETGGELSYMFLHPEKLKSTFAKGFDPTKPELGKYKGGQVIPMYAGGMVQASATPMYDGGLVVTDSLMAHGGQVNIDDFKTPARIDYPIGKEEGERRRTTTPKLEIERKIRENRVKAKLDLERKIKEEEKYIKQIKELGFTTVSAFKKAETEKARKANAAYWKKYGPMGNWKSETIQGRTGTEFVYPPGYSTKFKEGDQKIINEQEPLIKRARYLYNQKMKNKFNLEV